jgi:hypothetical protein
MNKRRMRRARRLGAGVVLVAATLMSVASPVGAHNGKGHGPKPPPQPKVQDVPGLGGLAGPFGLDTGPGGRIYVANQGAPPDPESGFPGLPGSIIEWRKGTATTVASFPEGGPSDVSVKGPNDLLYVLGAQGGEPTAGNDLGRVVKGQLKPTIDLGGFEATENPDSGQIYGPTGEVPADCLAQVPTDFLPLLEPYPGIIDSNVYSVDHDHRFGTTLVTDAAGNSVHLIGHKGIVKTWVLPPVTQTVTQAGIDQMNAELPPETQLPSCLIGLEWKGEPVPTSVVVGPDLMIYVSSLPGFPEAAGSGGIFRINPFNGQITRWAEGFTSAVDLAFDRSGNLLVAELFGGNGGGAIKKVHTSWSWKGLKAGKVTTLASDADGLILPSRVAVSAEGTIYATANLFGDGKVVKIRG